jgi:hypothetical protein
MNYYVYKHIIKNTNRVFYIGKGHGNRAWDKNGRSAYWNNITKNQEYIVEIVKDNLTEQDSYSIEKELIALYGKVQDKGCLVNMTDGGEGRLGYSWNNERLGCNNPMFGKKQTQETKDKIAHTKIGKPRSQQVKDILRLANLNKPKELHGMYGKQHTKEAKQKMSLKGKGKAKSASIILDLETGIFYRGWKEISNLLNLSITQLEWLRYNNKITRFKKV